MGVLTSEVGYAPAMPRREDHEVHKDMWRKIEKKKSFVLSRVVAVLLTQKAAFEIVRNNQLLMLTCRKPRRNIILERTSHIRFCYQSFGWAVPHLVFKIMLRTSSVWDMRLQANESEATTQ